MEEDSRFALFEEPNAYQQNFNPKIQAKKVVFAEPYENVPNFMIDNGFKKGRCDCIPKKPDKCKPQKPQGFNFDLKALMPLLSLFAKGNSNLGNLSSLMSVFAGGENKDISSLLNGVLSNKDAIQGILNLFNKPQKKKIDLKQTDFEIKNYTRVD